MSVNAGNLIAAVLLAAFLSILYWVYSDCRKRGVEALPWVAVVFFGNVLGLIFYLGARTFARSRANAERRGGATAPPRVPEEKT